MRTIDQALTEFLTLRIEEMSSSSIATNNSNMMSSPLHKVTDYDTDIFAHPAFTAMMKKIDDMSTQLKELHGALLTTRDSHKEKKLSTKQQLQQEVINKIAKKKARLFNS